MEQTDALMNSGELVKTSKGELRIKALSAKKLFELTKVMAESLSSLMELGVKYGSSGSAIHPDFVLLCLQQIPQLFGILDKATDQEEGFCETLSLAELSSVLVVFLQVNEVPKIIENFAKAKEQIIPQIPQAKP